MDELKVSETTVPGVLEHLRRGEWLVPKFQREFVWTTEQVSALVQSILDARPIGMATLWEQPAEAQIEVERISIPDNDPESLTRSRRFFGPEVVSSKRFALLDGRQRCTAIAMAFGGFRAQHGVYRHAGRYFLDVKATDPRKRVIFLREGDVQRKGLITDAASFSQGLFPLSSNNDGEAVLGQWMRYLQAIQNPENYAGHRLPEPVELEKRNKVLGGAFEGIVKTKLAVYSVPDKYNLSDICEIFETLNTTGTKVSTVDLIHSWLYADTANDATGPMFLRDWMSDLGEVDGAKGWSDPTDRPELIAQFVTATYVSLDQKPKPRPVGGAQQGITSVKAGDLLATPTEHWRSVQANSEVFAEYIGRAQQAVARGFFPWQRCPYPVSLSIHVALRWKWRFEGIRGWGSDELDALFRAFFWRNALSRRYDQGFLTQLGTDLMTMLRLLETRPSFQSSGAWANDVSTRLDEDLDFPVPSKEHLQTWLLDGNHGGALQKALLLPMFAGANKDLVNTRISIRYPENDDVDLHHIYPKAWCRTNKVGRLAEILDADRSSRDFVESAANLMPMSRVSNNSWKHKIPGQFLRENGLRFEQLRETLQPVFIDAEGFELLWAGADSLPRFWEHRAGLMADDLITKTKVVL